MTIQALALHESGEQMHGQGRSAGSLRVCLISLAGELFAIDLQNVREVFEVESFTPVPGMPVCLIGVANLRGLVIPLVDLRPLLGLAVTGPPPPFGVVLRHGPHQLAILVERVPEIRTIQPEQLLPAIQNGRGATRPFVSVVLKVEDRLGGMLEIPAVFSQVEGRTLHMAQLT
ncbi:chemotaxis protein CheW [Candidatus Nitrospira bockiana]